MKKERPNDPVSTETGEVQTPVHAPTREDVRAARE